MKNNKYEIDMVNGSIMDKLISFALPLMISGILQLAFNAVDIIVVGQFSGSKSLAAVGSTTALINVFVNLFMGISLGANVLAARFYAAGKEKEMSKTVHTAIMIALISGIVMGVVGVIFARGALEIMGTPDDVIGLSTIYMRIYFCGMPFFACCRRYKETSYLFDYFRLYQCTAQSVFCNSVQTGCCRCCNRYDCFAVCFQRTCIILFEQSKYQL